jgi:hypothetical protein
LARRLSNEKEEYLQRGSALALCAPVGQEEFLAALGATVANRTSSTPDPSEVEQKLFMGKVKLIAPKYRTARWKCPFNQINFALGAWPER